jgi:arsenite methyltransferase
MNNASKRPATPDYGIDSPKELRRNGLYGLGGIAMGISLGALASGGALGIVLSAVSLVSGILLVANVTIAYWGSKSGKLRMRDQIITQLPWRGDEQVLDIGCGHGLMLIGAAKRLTTGKATGIDMWLQDSQLHNDIDLTLANASLEGVGDRVTVRRADARDLPYDNNAFDVVLSSWVIHTMTDPDDRARVLKEIARVVKPGGRVVIVDFDFVNEYVKYFRDKEWKEIQKSRPSMIFVTPTYTMSCVKP